MTQFIDVYMLQQALIDLIHLEHSKRNKDS